MEAEKLQGHMVTQARDAVHRDSEVMVEMGDMNGLGICLGSHS